MVDLANMLAAAAQARQSDEDVSRLPMRNNYGQRWGGQDGLKGVGFNGPVQLQEGNVASEYSLGEPGRQFPSIAQGMPQPLLAQALTAARMGQQVPHAAGEYAHAKAQERRAAGASPFFEPGRDPYPAWSPDQHWERPAVMPRR